MTFATPSPASSGPDGRTAAGFATTITTATTTPYGVAVALTLHLGLNRRPAPLVAGRLA